jgi:V8-like Glu-specific endopeptidase
MRAATLLLTALLCASTTACTAVYEDAESSGAAIIDGTESGESEDAVVLVVNPGGTCTGTLVAPNLVLTARHCLSRVNRNDVLTSDHPVRNVEIFTGRDALDRSEANESPDARGQRLIATSRIGTTLGNDDIAFLVLDQAIEGRVASLRLDSRVRAGEEVTAVGFGTDRDDNSPTSRMRRAVEVTSVRSNADFLVGTAICWGDSGGPALSARGAVLGVAADFEGGPALDPDDRAATCRDARTRGVFTSLFRNRALVERAFAAAGAQPRLEGDADETETTNDSPANDDDTGSGKGGDETPADDESGGSGKPGADEGDSNDEESEPPRK